MTPWTALLESIHSALIDELTERHPDPKPTLGMPVRHSRYSPPESASRVLLCEAVFEREGARAAGLTALAFQPEFLKALGIDARVFWEAILKRAGTEFHRRGIRPVLGPPREQERTAPLPKGILDPTRVIWIPFQIPEGVCYLGLGA